MATDTTFAPLADLKTFGFRIPELSDDEMERRIGRLLDAALAVPGAEIFLASFRAPTVDWHGLLTDWVAMARANDEDVSLSVKHVDGVEGQFHAFTSYQVMRAEDFCDRRLMTIDVSTVPL